jgi:hypothetical protein
VELLTPAPPLLAADGRQLGWMSSVLDISERTRAEQLAAEQQNAASSADSGSSAPPTSVGGLLGGVGKRMAQRRNNNDKAACPKDRATVLTTSS